MDIREFSLTQRFIAGGIVVTLVISILSFNRIAKNKEELSASEAYLGLEQVLRREKRYYMKEQRFTSNLEELEMAFSKEFQNQNDPLKDEEGIGDINPNKNIKRKFNYAFDTQDYDWIRFKAKPRYAEGPTFYGTLYKDGRMELKGRYTQRQLR